MDGRLVFSERERGRYMSSSVCLSVCRHSSVCNVRAPTQAIEIFGNVSTPLIRWPSIDIRI